MAKSGALALRRNLEVGGASASSFIITHNIPSAMRTADYIGVLYQSRLVRFAAREEMRDTDDPIINQFLRGRAFGPIGMDELATEETDVERELVERAQARIERDGVQLPV